ncbi:MAG: uroporphyrinogen decarboxylase family protein [Terracidiphilus sp.]
MPIGADLLLHEEPDPKYSRNNGAALGRVIEHTARRWNTPLAVPLMDLRLEKADLLARIGISGSNAEIYQFTASLDEFTLNALCDGKAVPACPGSVARDQALSYIAAIPDLIPIGMAIGPFSLATRLMADPIAAVAMAGSGVEPEDSDEVRLLDHCLRAAESAVIRSVQSQIAHGARAIMICEPAACTAFISPRQLRAGSNIFERFVIEPNLRLKAALDAGACDLIFHDCGELIDSMVEAFAYRLHPVMLSLGSSRKLWEDAHLVPADVVLYGNLPTRKFYSDGAMPVEEVIRLATELLENMKACGHPHILGSECDVLFVPEARDAILTKVAVMMVANVTAASA